MYIEVTKVGQDRNRVGTTLIPIGHFLVDEVKYKGDTSIVTITVLGTSDSDGIPISFDVMESMQVVKAKMQQAMTMRTIEFMQR